MFMFAHEIREKSETATGAHKLPDAAVYRLYFTQ